MNLKKVIILIARTSHWETSDVATKVSPGGMAIGFTNGVKYVGSENNNVISGDSQYIERDCVDYYSTTKEE